MLFRIQEKKKKQRYKIIKAFYELIPFSKFSFLLAQSVVGEQNSDTDCVTATRYINHFSK